LISVLIADDEESLREALRDLIAREADLEVIAVVADAEAAIELARLHQPDVALLDVKMPAGGGQRAAREIRMFCEATRVIALSAYEDRASVLEMLRGGAVGYAVKGTPAAEIVEAIRRAARGQASISAALMASVLEALCSDLEERRKSEETSRRNAERFGALLDSAPDSVVMVDGRGRMVLVNARTEEMFGYERSELLRQPIEMLLPDRFRERHERHLGEYFRNPRTRPMGLGLDLSGRRKDGSEFPVDISLSPLETDAGPLATAFIHDISDRLWAEEARRKSEERFGALIESAPDSVIIVDERGRIELVNAETELLFGYGRDELYGQPIEMLMPDRFRERHVDHRSRYLADPITRPMGVGLELAGRRRDGSEFPIDISLSALETEEGRLVTAFIRDNSERLAAYELQRSLSERRALLAHLVAAGEEERLRIASDIHDDSIQVITAAGMRLQILRDDLTDPDQVTLLDSLDQTIQLSISRLRHLLFELRPPALDKEGLVPALHLYVREAESQSPATSYRVEDRLVNQPDPETRLIVYRIVQEALTNVRKHADARTASVKIEERDGGFAVSVADDGAGFSPADTGPVPGHLGLATMRERAELAGGWLKLDSSPGAGTTVAFWIPREGTAPQGEQPELVASEPVAVRP